ncbi:MAG: PKD domain-containing protein [Candidatus Thermoplasmatota archaeon]|nr:PKD domain-containing protein [Candidatus Thermoplasmatota archaeon]
MKHIAICMAVVLLATPLASIPGAHRSPSSGIPGDDTTCTASCIRGRYTAAAAVNNQTWSIEMVDSLGKTGQHTDIDVGPDGTTYISYYDFLDEDLRCAIKTGVEWNIDTVDADGVVGAYTSIDVHGDTGPGISYYDETNKDLKYAVLDNGGWTVETVDTDGDVGRYSSLSIDDQGTPHIVYYDASGGNLKYATRSGGSWNIETVASDGDAGRYAALALDGQGTPHCTYGVDETTLMYAYRTPDGWETRQVDSEIKLFESTAIAIEDDVPHIAYFDLSNEPNWRLRYATPSNGEWTIEVADPLIHGFWNERGLAIAVRDDVVHLGYFQWDDWDVGYAYRYGDTWTTEIVESEGDVGAFASLALDGQGYPHMSYMDRSNLALKHAHKIQYAPVTPSQPDGPARGRTGTAYTYTTSTADLDGDDIQYGWDWDGDRTVDEWTSFTASGDEMDAAHTWDSDGTYVVRVKARDSTGLESDWSEPLQISMPRARTSAATAIWQWLMEHLFSFSPLFSSSS